MSLIGPKVSLIEVNDGLTYVNEEKCYAVLKGSDDISYYNVPSNSASTSQVQFSLPINSPQTIISPLMYITYYCTFTFTGTGPLAIGTLDGLRQFPINSCITSIALVLGNETFNAQPNQYLPALLKYKDDYADSLAKDYTVSPAMPDYYQNYSDYTTYGSIRNPLSQIGSNSMLEPRGGYNYTVNSGTQVTVQVTEPLFLLEPLETLMREKNPGFVGLQNITFNINNNSSLSRMWSSANPNISGVSVSFYKNPVLTFKQLKPRVTQYIPETVMYPYFERTPYTTNIGTLAPNASTTIQSNTIQLKSIPHSIYIFARQRIQDQTFQSSDAFAQISAITLNFAQRTSLLSTATPQSLYQICVRNGYNQGFQAWNTYNGSVIRLKPSLDLPVGDLYAPGSIGVFNLQAQCTVANLNQSNSINFDLLLVTEEEGVVEISRGVCKKAPSVLGQNDVLNVRMKASFDQVEQASGGSFKSFFNDVWSGIKKVATHPITRQIASQVAVPLLKKAVGAGKKMKVKHRKHRRTHKRGGFLEASADAHRKESKKDESGSETESDSECSASDH